MNDIKEPKHLNRLAKATSPYLLQHAANPVDWYEWGDEAFEKAKSEDKLIFLSIGYSACHWCHVMEHESFETQIVADALNASFVSIKVDREERPDIDEIFMAFTQAKTGRGGWPMSLWLMPDGTPFHAGTYFPQNQFLNILRSLSDRWANNRDQIASGADQTHRFFNDWAQVPVQAEADISTATIDQLANRIASYFDRTLGGMGRGNNRFPPSTAMELLLRSYRRTNKASLLHAVEVTLDQMARGGIYDHIGGGICRYSTDKQWLVPHFEKMLYDQGLVSSIYLDAYQVTGKRIYGEVAADIFDYVLSDLRGSEGAFYSSRDADSEGLEGAFYIWTVEQVTELLGEEDAALFGDYYDVTSRGNWFEHRGHAPAGPKNILHITKSLESFAQSRDLDVDSFKSKLKSWRQTLLAVRSKRVPPPLDDKILVNWNGLMISSLAKGARVLDEPKYAQAAAKAADFILNNMRKDGRLLHTHRKGESRLTAYLDDYSFFIDGLLNLYEATLDQRWLGEALALTETSIKFYLDQDNGAFFFTASDGEKLIVRSKQPHDKAIPSGNSIHAHNLYRLAVLFDRIDLRETADGIVSLFSTEAVRSPTAYERLLSAVDFRNDRVKEIAIIGDLAAEDTAKLIRTVYDRYLPNKVLVHAPDTVEQTDIPLLYRKTKRGGKATAYVCEGYRCKLPVTDAADLAKQLDEK